MREMGMTTITLNSTALYMKDIKRYALLTAEQEIELAIRIADGDEAARHTMINANLRLVVKIARKYMNGGLALDDLIEEGNLGLIHAVGKFDIAHECRFSTYATWWIRQNIERGIMNMARTIRVPVHVSKEINSMKRSANQLRAILDREPTENEIALKMGKSKTRVQELKEAQLTTPSADQTISGTEDFTIHDIVEDMDAEQPSDVINKRICHGLVHNWLTALNPRERNVMMLRYGIGDSDDPWTLEAIGDHLGVTRERIRQIQVAALAKLRSLPEARNLLLEEVF